MLRSKDRPVPGPAYMSNDQKADYLQSLRQPNPSRPSGSRPPPPSRYTSLKRAETEAKIPQHGAESRPSLPTSNSMPVIPGQASAHLRIHSTDSAGWQLIGQSLVRPPSATTTDLDDTSSPNDEPMPRKPGVTYLERGTRWMEKQETQSLRMALEDMDFEDEKKLHAAAQDEAADLVWRHQNPDAASAQDNAPYPNPDMRRDYHRHLRKGSYQRSHSQDTESERKILDGGHEERKSVSSKRRSTEVLRKITRPGAEVVTVAKQRTASGKKFEGLANAVADDIEKAHRRSSSGSRRVLSGEKKRVYMHPSDRIWEDPQEHPTQQPRTTDPPASTPVVQPAQTRKNPFARVRLQAEKLERSKSEPIVTNPMRHSVEVQNNAPTQSKRPWYMSNEPLPPTPPKPEHQLSDEVAPKTTPTKDDREIRSDDIRAATSKKRNEYSPKLPRPTIVSDKPGRPIVSFKQNLQLSEIVLDEVQAAPFPPAKDDTLKPRQLVSPNSHPIPRTVDIPGVDKNQAYPTSSPYFTSCPIVPTIVLPDDSDFAQPLDVQSTPATPGITVEPPAITVQPPTINVTCSDELPESAMPPARPSRTIAARPSAMHAATSPFPISRAHYTPSVRQSGTLCAHCALPIAGRILSASGERFHPSCFVCHRCHTNLELVAFYPEPDKARSERLSRIEARQHGFEIPGQDGMTTGQIRRQEFDDGDETLRFFCHLDFHELFSPRCKSCKTPIEGEVIVACGAEWHTGHFFCAQCGDPFDSTTPFVEKEGYAWCVGCHTNRYSSKCRKCKKPVIDTVVKALGHDWHGTCFVCSECNGEFEDGRYFLRGHSEDPVCVRCEERRLKA